MVLFFFSGRIRSRRTSRVWFSRNTWSQPKPKRPRRGTDIERRRRAARRPCGEAERECIARPAEVETRERNIIITIRYYYYYCCIYRGNFSFLFFGRQCETPRSGQTNTQPAATFVTRLASKQDKCKTADGRILRSLHNAPVYRLYGDDVDERFPARNSMSPRYALRCVLARARLSVYTIRIIHDRPSHNDPRRWHTHAQQYRVPNLWHTMRICLVRYCFRRKNGLFRGHVFET